ncbi:hypothetical protein [Chroococcus sp. FPU101]|uniref:hypothetical protein n=1 Tax=Chroococcus sp. FPU101 TaxID=1974212 RepID=UPI001A8CCD7D|nr:hypothetical protein [Chroococcus sp. FPU101]GFE70886.1 hypothetical protein CFPU101_34960 [Chroococcus sp. FPU101]
MLVSTFELLVKRQLPREMDIMNLPPGATFPPEVEKLSRTVIQGYFLTISNLNAFDVTLSFVFTIVTNPPIAVMADLLGFIDVDESNIFELPDVEPDLAQNKIRFTRKIPASDTGLFLIQPNILNTDLLLGNKQFEVRGYVEVFISSLSTGYNAAKLLLTPEHRGTFYTDLTQDAVQLDQIAYSLPTAHGGSLFELSFH